MRITSAKKALSLIVVLCMVLALVPASLVSAAGESDFRSVVRQLNALQDKGKFLDTLWESLGEKFLNSNETLTEEDVFSTLKSNLETSGLYVISPESGDNGQISEGNVRKLIGKILEKRDRIIDVYSRYNIETLFTAYKTLKKIPDASKGEVAVQILKALRDSNEKLVTFKDDKFVPLSTKPAADVLRILTGITFAEGSEFGELVSKLDEKYSKYLDELNEEIYARNLTEDAKYVLDDILGIYQEYVAPTPTPSTDPSTDPGTNPGNPGGPGTPSSPSPSTSPTPTPAPKLPDAGEIEKITDPDKALEAAVDMINEAATLIKDAENEGKSPSEVNQAMLAVAEKVLEKVNVKEVKAVVDENGAKAVIDEAEAEKLIASLDKIADLTKKLNEALEKNGADVRVEAVLNIKVEADKTAEAVHVELPASVIAAALSNKLDKIAIDTGITKLVAAPEVFAADSGKNVVFNVQNMDTSKLSEEVQKAVGGSTVYGFTLSVDGNVVENFVKPVQVFIPYTLKEGENPEKITVFYVNDEGVLENVIGKYDAASNSVEFKTAHFSGYVAKLNNVSFEDTAAFDWAEANIEAMAAKGILNGVGGGNFNPEANITRAEFAAMIVRAFKLQDSSAKNEFSDVDDSAWYSSEVASAVKAGLIQGKGNGIFAPEENITRQDMTVIIAKAISTVKEKKVNTQSLDKYVGKFKDSSEIESYAKDAVGTAVKYELIKGVGADSFAPVANATRAEAAVIVYRLFHLN